MTLAVSKRGDPHVLSEVQGKGTLVVKTQIQSNIHDGCHALSEFLTGCLEPQLHDEVPRAHFEGFLKFAIQLAGR